MSKLAILFLTTAKYLCYTNNTTHIHIGEYNTLTILRDTEPGLFLGDTEENDVLLPNRYVPETFEIGDDLLVFWGDFRLVIQRSIRKLAWKIFIHH